MTDDGQQGLVVLFMTLIGFKSIQRSWFGHHGGRAYFTRSSG